MAKRILVTGVSGLIGGLVGRDLARDYDVRALNRRPVEGMVTTEADITDFDAIRPAFTDIDTVVHMAAYLGKDERQQIDVNVTGTYNVFKAARGAGVERIVFASSGAVQSALEKDEPIRAMVEARLQDIPEPRPLVTHMDPVRPGQVYGAVKVFGEALARVWAETHGISVLCIRLGRVRPENRPANAREARRPPEPSRCCPDRASVRRSSGWNYIRYFLRRLRQLYPLPGFGTRPHGNRIRSAGRNQAMAPAGWVGAVEQRLLPTPPTPIWTVMSKLLRT